MKRCCTVVALLVLTGCASQEHAGGQRPPPEPPTTIGTVAEPQAAPASIVTAAAAHQLPVTPLEHVAASEPVSAAALALLAGMWQPDMEAIARLAAESERKGAVNDGFWLIRRTELLVIRDSGEVTYCGWGNGRCRLRDGQVVVEGIKRLEGLWLIPAADSKGLQVARADKARGLPFIRRFPDAALDPAAVVGVWRLDQSATVESLREDGERVRRLAQLAADQPNAFPPLDAAQLAEETKRHREDAERSSGASVRIEPASPGGHGLGELSLHSEGSPATYTIDQDVLLLTPPGKDGEERMTVGFTLKGGRLKLEFGFVPWVFAK